MGEKTKAVVKLSAAAVAVAAPLILHFEGTIFRSYRDPIGIVTACTGHTGPELRMGQAYTPAQCREMLYADIQKHAQALSCIDKPLSDKQQAAFVSFAFNVGTEAFCGSTLVKKANAGDMAGACAELSRWTRAGGKELPGLVKRRAAERALCEEET